MLVETIVDRWLDGNLPDDFALLLTMKQTIAASGREMNRSAALIDDASLADIYVAQQMLLLDVHISIEEKMRAIAQTL